MAAAPLVPAMVVGKVVAEVGRELRPAGQDHIDARMLASCVVAAFAAALQPRARQASRLTVNSYHHTKPHRTRLILLSRYSTVAAQSAVPVL